MAETTHNNSSSFLNSNQSNILYTRLAEKEINNGKPEKAIDILLEGIQKYSNYPTSFFLYGEALLTVGKVEDAKNAFHTGIDLLGFQDTSDHYLKLIPETYDDPFQKNTEINIPTIGDNIPEENINETFDVEENSGDTDFTELADKLSNAKLDIPQSPDNSTEIQSENKSDIPNSSGRSLVSETLARIYFSQENYIEAKEIYQTLIEIQPEREDHYRKRLEEIDVKLGAHS